MGRFYITTAIDYPNSAPHLGTAYEKIGADVIARYHRSKGDDVLFVMGLDEHSQNVRKKAAEMGLPPQEYCDRMAVEFQGTWKRLGVSNDAFIQTTSKLHRDVVRDIASRVWAGRDSDGRPLIFKAPYEGHYCVSCEAFYPEKELADGLCPNHRSKPEWIKEENYFFRLSSFAPALGKLFDENPDFLRPASKCNEVLRVLERGLEDVSMSRANRDWGVKLPFDESAVAYVWFDALINYVSAVGPIGGERYQRYWPADLHVIGKDITRFHCLIWPAMLMAAGLPVPRSVWAHGFVSIKGEKMSKTLGNIADPNMLASTHGADALRYHLMREVPWDRDGDFTNERLRNRYNADLANDLGNLLSRTVAMVTKYLGGELKKPGAAAMGGELDRIAAIMDRYSKLMDDLAMAPALEETWNLVSEANLLIDRTQPWQLARDPANSGKLSELFYVLLERLRWVGIALAPVMPEKTAALLGAIGCDAPGDAALLSKAPAVGQWPAYRVTTGPALFPRIE